MHLSADVMVIPALSIRDENQDTSVISWIKNHFSSNTRLLNICDGVATGPATRFYDGKSITCHASDIDGIKAYFRKPIWVQNVSVAKTGKLFSTAGVSNAVEDSFVVIDEIFAAETAKNVAADINYSDKEIMLAHKSIALNGGNKFAVEKKIFLRRNRNIEVLLQKGINEFAKTSAIDTYGSTFPASFKSYMLNDSTIRTMYGLSLIFTGNKSVKRLHELHLIMPEAFSEADQVFFKKTEIVHYENGQRQYLFDVYFKRITDLYGQQYEKILKVSLDYN